MPYAASLYYAENPRGVGSKPPLVLIHGAGGTHLHWPAALRRLNGYRVYALDLPGHGKSEGAGEQSILTYARSVVDWMDAIGLRRAVFAGHSMGGAIAQTLALEFPTRVMGLVLVGTGAKLRVAPAILENAASESTFPRAVETIVNWAFSSSTDARMVEIAARRWAEVRPAVLHGDFVACDRFDVMDRLEEIPVPTLVVCGEEDQLTPLRFSQYLAENIPQATLVTVAKAGHMVMLEQPQAVAQAVEQFLEGIAFRPGGT